MPGCSAWSYAEALRIHPCHGATRRTCRGSITSPTQVPPDSGSSTFRVKFSNRGQFPYRYFLKVEAVTAMAMAESTAKGRITKFGCTETGIARYTTQAITMLGQTRRLA